MTVSLSITGVSFLITGSIMSYYENYWLAARINYWKEYYKTNKLTEKQDYYDNKIPDANKKQLEFEQYKFIFLISGSVLLSFVFIPVIFLVYYVIKNYRMFQLLAKYNPKSKSIFLTLSIPL